MTARRVVHPLLLTFGALLLVAACTGGSPEAESLAISQHAAPESIVEDPAIGAAITDSPPVPSLSSTTETAGNLIRNPGFEAGLIEWRSTRFINPADSATYHPAVGRSISGATSAAGVEAQPGNLGRLYQDVTARVVVGRTYEIGGWIRTEGVEGEVVIGLDYVRADGWTPGAGSYVREVGRLTGTRDWTYFESDPFVLPPAPPEAGASALWFLFDFNNGSGTAWWDDVFLRELDHAAAASGCLNSASLLTARAICGLVDLGASRSRAPRPGTRAATGARSRSDSVRTGSSESARRSQPVGDEGRPDPRDQCGQCRGPDSRWAVVWTGLRLVARRVASSRRRKHRWPDR